MLYDQAQLLTAYSLAHMGGHDYKHVIQDIVHYVKTRLSHEVCSGSKALAFIV